MALPGNVLSQDITPAAFEPPRDIWKVPTHDYARGGVALADPSQGLSVKNWHAFLNEARTQILVEADGVSPTLVTSDIDITEISLTFDTQMRPFVAYVAGGIAKYYWFDPLVPGFVTTSLPAGSTNPRCSIDDIRPQQSANADIILAYMRDGSLMMRMQRDRYLIEYELDMYMGSAELIQIGMNRGGRFQFQVKP